MAGAKAGTFATEVLVHEQSLRARARTICATQADADDLVQDTLLRAFEHYPALQDRSNIRGWLFKILTNLLYDRQRHAKVARSVPFGPEHDVAFEPPAPPRHKSIEWEDVEAVLPQLPEHLRRPIELRAQDVSYADIGQKLATPTNTVATRIRRAYEELRKLLGITPGDDET